MVDAARLLPQPMTPDDLPEVMRIESVVYTHPWTAGNFRDALAAGYEGWLLRDEAGVLMAYAVLMSAPDEVHLLNLSVAEDQQRRGLGGALLTWVQARAHALGLPTVLLEVRVSNTPALELYRRVGYETIGLRRGYYPALVGREDALVMRKVLVSAS